MNLQKLTIFLGLLLDVIGIAIIIPAFPELKLYYGINDFQVTLGLTVYSLFAFLSAPVLGQLSDKFGRKGRLVGCVIGSFFSYVVLLVTQSYWIFLISRVINGITGGNISILQAVLTDISPDEKTKQKNFGLMGAFFGIGFIIGPLLGALMLRIGGVENIFLFGTILSALEVILLYFGFSNTNTPVPERHISFNSFMIMKKYFKNPDMYELLLSLGLLGIGGFIINIGLGLHMQNLFGTSGEQYGYYLALSGLIFAINLGFLIRRFWMKYFSHTFLILLSHLVMIAGYLMMAQMHDKILFLGLFYGIIAVGGIYGVVYNIEIMTAAPKDKIGEVSGMLGGMQSLFMCIGPLIAGVLLTNHINIFYGTVVCVLISFAVIGRRLLRK